jgi:hypothetical protein
MMTKELIVNPKRMIRMGSAVVGLALIAGGCASEPPPQAAVPVYPGTGYVPHQPPPKPLPESATNPPPAVGPYSDQPILDQRLPEEQMFLEAYDKVSRPTLSVQLNRPQNTDYYDEAGVRTLDYQALQTVLSDWMSCGGQVHIVTPQSSPDVTIQVDVHPTNQAGGPQVRLVAQAVNTRGGDVIGNAAVDIPLPLDMGQINEYTRFIAAKLMVGMAGSWDAYAGSPPPPPPPPARSAVPSTQMDLIP